MKRVILITAIGSALLLASCSKEKKTEKTIVGTWNIEKTADESQTAKGTVNIKADIKGSCTFNKDKTGSCELNGTINIDGTMGPSNTQVSIVHQVSGTYQIKNWDVQDDKMIIEYADGSREVYLVTEASKNKIVLDRSDEGTTLQVNAQGNTLNLEVHYSMKMER